MNLLTKIEEIAVECNFFEYGYVNIESLKYYPEVRRICEGNACCNYATSWACPPAIGTLEDSFDFEGMTNGLLEFKKRVDQYQKHLDGVLSDFVLLSNEGCGRCKECTYPNEPCRFPQLLHHSLEGYGFIVNQLAHEAGVRYNNGPNTVTYFGALLFKI